MTNQAAGGDGASWKVLQGDCIERTAEAIIDRELEEHENMAASLRERLNEVEKQVGRLKVARDALREPVPA